MHYRAEIDGLRAVAVLAVIAFHAGFEFAPGGFIGVDVFFVISGYLIGGIVLSALNEGSFSLVDFFERRARRILPALFFLLICLLPAAWQWMSPAEFADLSRSIVATVLFFQNILLWKDSGYFSLAAEFKPLLHTWSLSVEEQFYFGFPVLAMLLWRFGRKAVVGGLVSLSLASFILSIWASSWFPVASFYLLPTRAWELLFGVLAVFAPASFRESRWIKEIGGLAGVAAIVWAALYLNAQTPFPGTWALLPTVGTALVILFGDRETMAGRLLSLRPVVGIGLISYSAYLWHQPLFAFARIYSLDTPPPEVFALLSALTLVLAYLSWRFIETPFRRKTSFARGKVFSGSGLVAALLVGIAATVVARDGFKDRGQLPESVSASFSWSERSRPCSDIPYGHVTEDRWYCEVNPPTHTHTHTGAPSFFVFGDSHAMAMFDAIEAYADATGRHGQITAFSGCIPLLGAHALRNDQIERNCFAMNRRVLEHVRTAGVRDLILIARWTYYTDGGYTGKDFSFISRSKDGQVSVEESRATFEKAVAETVAAYRSIGTTVHILEQVPQQRFQPEKLYRQAFMFSSLGLGGMNGHLLRHSILREESENLQSFVRRVFDGFKNQPHMQFVNFHELFCSEVVCPVGDAVESYYYDDDHLSQAGARRAATVLINKL